MSSSAAASPSLPGVSCRSQLAEAPMQPGQCLSLVPKVPLHHLKQRFIAERVDSGPGAQLGELLIQE